MAQRPRPHGTPGDLLTPAQVAEYLQLHKLTIYRYIREGRLPATRVGRALRVSRADIEQFLSDGKEAVARSRPQAHSHTSDRGTAPVERPASEPGTTTPAKHGDEIYVGPPREEQKPSRDVVVTVNPIDWVVRGLH